MTSTFSSEILGFLISTMIAVYRKTNSQGVKTTFYQSHRSSYALISMNDLDFAPIMHKLAVADVAPVRSMPMRGKNMGFKSGVRIDSTLIYRQEPDVVSRILIHAHRKKVPLQHKRVFLAKESIQVEIGAGRHLKQTKKV